MSNPIVLPREIEKLQQIHDLPSLVEYLQDDLGWPRMTISTISHSFTIWTN